MSLLNVDWSSFIFSWKILVSIPWGSKWDLILIAFTFLFALRRRLRDWPSGWGWSLKWTWWHLFIIFYSFIFFLWFPYARWASLFTLRYQVLVVFGASLQIFKSFDSNNLKFVNLIHIVFFVFESGGPSFCIKFVDSKALKKWKLFNLISRQFFDVMGEFSPLCLVCSSSTRWEFLTLTSLHPWCLCFPSGDQSKSYQL